MSNAVNTAGNPTEVQRERAMDEPRGWAGFKKRWGYTLLTILNVTIFFTLWQVVQSQAPVINPKWVPPPSDIYTEMLRAARNGTLQDAILFSYRNVAVGFGIAAVFGIPFGLAMGGFPTMRTVLGPYVWALYAAPIIAIQPILTLIFGLGAPAKILLIALISFFPLMINTMDGVATVDQSLLKAGRVFGASRLQLFTRVILPFTLPWVLTGLRLAATRALLGMIVSELFGSSQGLGYLIKKASDVSDSATAYGVIVIVVLTSVALVQLISFLEHKLTPWKQEIEL